MAGSNITPPICSVAAHAIKHAVGRAGVDKDYVQDHYLGVVARSAGYRTSGAALLARHAGSLPPVYRSTASARRACRRLRWPPTASARTVPIASWPVVLKASSIPSEELAEGSIGRTSAVRRHLHGDDRHAEHRRRPSGWPRICGLEFAWRKINGASVAAQQFQQVQGRNRPMRAK